MRSRSNLRFFSFLRRLASCLPPAGWKVAFHCLHLIQRIGAIDRCKFWGHSLVRGGRIVLTKFSSCLICDNLLSMKSVLMMDKQVVGQLRSGWMVLQQNIVYDDCFLWNGRGRHLCEQSHIFIYQLCDAFVTGYVDHSRKSWYFLFMNIIAKFFSVPVPVFISVIIIAFFFLIFIDWHRMILCLFVLQST